MTRVTRRAALLSGLGAAGAAVAGGITISRSQGPPPTMTLRLRDVVHGRPGVPPGEFPPHGSLAVPFARIEDSNGETIGSLESVAVPSSRGATIQQTFTFDDGTIVGLGPHAMDGPFAVVSGTGRYAGVTGNYHLRALDDTEDEAHDVQMHLTTPEA
jgi:hypothetical protein